MVTPELRNLSSPDLERPAVPSDPTDCLVALEASIGPKGARGEELFEFQVVTPRALAKNGLPRWGRGLLIVEQFSWANVERALERLLSHAHRDTWAEVAAVLNHELQWEYDNYQPFAG
jgi:hypothetical protein